MNKEILDRLDKIIELLKKERCSCPDEVVPEDFMINYPMECTCHLKKELTAHSCLMHDGID